MSKAVIFAPIQIKEIEDLFFTVISKKYNIKREIFEELTRYYKNNDIRNDFQYDVYYMLNIFNGQNIQFPTVDQLYDDLLGIHVYLDLEDWGKSNGKAILNLISYQNSINRHKEEDKKIAFTQDLTDYYDYIGWKYDVKTSNLQSMWTNYVTLIRGESANYNEIIKGV